MNDVFRIMCENISRHNLSHYDKKYLKIRFKNMVAIYDIR